MKKSSFPIESAPLHDLGHATGYSLRPLRSIISMLICIGCIATLIVVSSPVVLEAQTEWKDNYVTLAAEDQTNPSIARPSEGAYTIIVWEDTRDPASWHTDIYAQKIDNTNGLPMWSPPDGVPVCTAGGNQKNPRAAYDSLGNVVVVWEDYRNDSSKAAIYANCLSISDGSPNQSWTSNGKVVCSTRSHAERPRIAGGIDGCYITWVDWRNSSTMNPDSANRDIYLQYLNSSDGNYPRGGSYVWASNGVLVPGTSSFDDTNVELARDFHYDAANRDGVILVYQSKRDTSTYTSEPIFAVYANRFDAYGNSSWPDLRCANYHEEQVLPQIRVLGRYGSPGDTLATIVWMDERNDPDTPTSDIYGQQISRYQPVITNGSTTGFAICDQSNTQRYPELSLYERPHDPAHQISYLARVVCVWEDLRDVGSNGIDVYTATLDGVTAALVNSSGSTGEPVCFQSGDQTQPRVDNFLLDSDAYFVWRDGSSEGGTDDGWDIWYQSMELISQSFYLTEGTGKAVTLAKNGQTNPQAGGNVFVFADQRRDVITDDDRHDWNIYAETPGQCVGPKDMNWRDMFADVHQVGDAAAMRFAVDKEYNTFVVWEEPGEEEGTQDVYVQKLDKTGVPRWQNSGIRLNTSPWASHPDVTYSDSLGCCQVVWQQGANASVDSVYYLKLNTHGQRTRSYEWDEAKMPFIVYTPATPFDTTGIPSYPAYVSYLSDVAGGETEIGLQAGRNNDFQLLALDFDLSLIDHRLASSGTGEVYAVGWTTPNPGNPVDLALGWVYRRSQVPALYTFRVEQFGGCDIAAEFGGWYKNGYLVYCAGPGDGTMDLYALAMAAAGGGVYGPVNLTNQYMGRFPSNPSIVPDSSFNTDGYGGLLVAWNSAGDSLGLVRHQVQTNKLEFVTTGGGTIQWSNSNIINASEFCSDTTWPDIARISNLSGSDTMAYIVYEGITELCTPSRSQEVLGQFVFYNTYDPYARGAQFDTPFNVQGRQVAPGEGYYIQSHPIVKTSANNSVSIYWIDGRASKDLVMGTRSYADTSMLYWLKGREEEQPSVPVEVVLEGHYPNPLYMDRSSISNVVVQTSTESTARLVLFDNLGREVATIHDGPLSAGRNVIRFDAGSLRTGMYHYALIQGENVTIRGLIVVR